jgi:hypothetical protein
LRGFSWRRKRSGDANSRLNMAVGFASSGVMSGSEEKRVTDDDACSSHTQLRAWICQGRAILEFVRSIA